MVFSTCRTQRHYGMWNVKLAVLRHTCLSLRHTVCACSWSSFLHRSDNHHGYSQLPACESCLLRRCLLVFASLPTHTSSSCDTASPAPPPTVMVSSKFLDRLMQKTCGSMGHGCWPGIRLCATRCLYSRCLYCFFSKCTTYIDRSNRTDTAVETAHTRKDNKMLNKTPTTPTCMVLPRKRFNFCSANSSKRYVGGKPMIRNSSASVKERPKPNENCFFSWWQALANCHPGGIGPTPNFATCR